MLRPPGPAERQGRAFGIGVVNPPLATAAIGVVEPQRSGAASGINSTFRQVGTATGIAGLGALLQVRVSDRLSEALGGVQLPPGARDGLVEMVSAGNVHAASGAGPPGARADLLAAAQDAFISGLDEILVVAAAVAFVGGFLALVLVRERDFVGRAEPAATRA